MVLNLTDAQNEFTERIPNIVNLFIAKKNLDVLIDDFEKDLKENPENRTLSICLKFFKSQSSLIEPDEVISEFAQIFKFVNISK